MDAPYTGSDAEIPPFEGQEIAYSWSLFQKFNDHAVPVFREELGADIVYADQVLK